MLTAPFCIYYSRHCAFVKGKTRDGRLPVPIWLIAHGAGVRLPAGGAGVAAVSGDIPGGVADATAHVVQHVLGAPDDVPGAPGQIPGEGAKL